MYLHRGYLISAAVLVPLTFFAFQTEEIMQMIGMNAEASRYAEEYLVAYLPGLYFQVFLRCQVKLLNNLGHMMAPMLSQIVVIVLHPIWCYLLVFKADLGITGVGIAGIITDFSVYAFMMAYSLLNEDVKECCFWPDSRMFQELGDYLKLGLPSCFMLCLDTYAGSSVTVIAGYVQIETQSAQVVLGSIMVFLYMVARGLE